MLTYEAKNAGQKVRDGSSEKYIIINYSIVLVQSILTIRD